MLCLSSRTTRIRVEIIRRKSVSPPPERQHGVPLLFVFVVHLPPIVLIFLEMNTGHQKQKRFLRLEMSFFTMLSDVQGNRLIPRMKLITLIRGSAKICLAGQVFLDTLALVAVVWRMRDTGERFPTG